MELKLQSRNIFFSAYKNVCNSSVLSIYGTFKTALKTTLYWPINYCE